ncbi:MAG: GNAT family N-acetyltransferase [Planctomycetia bacterium]|jgi:RimJ/RimL family protein N-acetyltransferase
MSSGPAYRLATNRLQLACVGPEDIVEMHEVVRAERTRLAEHLEWARDEPLSLEARMSQVRAMRARFDLDAECFWTVREDGRFVGMCGLHAGSTADARSLGYWLREDSCGRGLATEAACAALAAAFVVAGATRVEIRAAASNTRSSKLATRLGFAREGVLQHASTARRGGREDLELHALLREATPAAARRAVRVRGFDALDRELFDTARAGASAFR